MIELVECGGVERLGGFICVRGEHRFKYAECRRRDTHEEQAEPLCKFLGIRPGKNPRETLLKHGWIMARLERGGPWASSTTWFRVLDLESLNEVIWKLRPEALMSSIEVEEVSVNLKHKNLYRFSWKRFKASGEVLSEWLRGRGER